MQCDAKHVHINPTHTQTYTLFLHNIIRANYGMEKYKEVFDLE